MSRGNRILGLVWFLLRFIVIAPILLALWWSLVPYYGYVMVQATGSMARFALGVPVMAVGVNPEGLMNTGTTIFYELAPADRPAFTRSLPIALLVTNLVPYAALVLATLGLHWKRRLRVLAAGCGILIAGHFLYATLLLRFQDALREYSEIATSTIQFFIVLPVVLWIWLVYSERITGYINESNTQPGARAAHKD